jgi:hypothetical protein
VLLGLTVLANQAESQLVASEHVPLDTMTFLAVSVPPSGFGALISGHGVTVTA